MKIIAIANQKGGVGKTTTAVNLGSLFGLPTIPLMKYLYLGQKK